MNVETLLFYFFVYAFLGWVLETIHETIKTRSFVNGGFLHGPFVPIYGVAVVCILSMDDHLARFLPVWGRLIAYTVLASALEYYTSLLLEEIFGLKMWDYSDHFANLHGRICLQYSFYWLGLSATLLYILDPSLSRVARVISEDNMHLANRLLGIYMLADLLWSIRSLNRFKEALATLHEKYLTITGSAYDSLMGSVRRLTTSFPNLRNYVTVNAGENVDEGMRLNLPDLRIKGLPRLRRRDADAAEEVAAGMESEAESLFVDEEYLEIVRDILDHVEFGKLKQFRHHTGTIFDHALAVSYLAWRISRRYGWDERSAARGGLLHDFFLYDWRNCIQENGEKTKGLHAFTHARMALENAARHFTLNNLERDIIRKHMWPVTMPFPRYRESLLVTFLDKYVATREMVVGRAMKHRLPKGLDPCPDCQVTCTKE